MSGPAAWLHQAGATLDARERSKHMAVAQQRLQDSGVLSQTLWRAIFSVGANRINNFRLHPTNYLQLHRVWLT